MTRITVHFFLFSILCALAYMGMEAAFGLEGGSGSGAVTTAVAALMTGQFYGQRYGSVPDKGFCWFVALWLTVVSLVVFGGLFYAVGGLDEIIASIGAGMLMLIFLFAAVISVLIIRFAFRWGAKQAVRHAAA